MERTNHQEPHGWVACVSRSAKTKQDQLPRLKTAAGALRGNLDRAGVGVSETLAGFRVVRARCRFGIMMRRYTVSGVLKLLGLVRSGAVVWL